MNIKHAVYKKRQDIFVRAVPSDDSMYVHRVALALFVLSITERDGESTSDFR